MAFPKIQALIADRAEVVAKAANLIETAEDENRDLSAEEQTQFDVLQAEIQSFNARIERQKQIDAESVAFQGVSATKRAEGRIEGGEPRIKDDPKRGFQSYGEFAKAIMAAANPGDPMVDERLRIGAAPTTYANEASGSDGGYVIPPEFDATIRRHSLEEGAILPMTDNTPVSGNSMTFPADETTPWGSSGIRSRWASEGSQATQDKPVLKSRTLRLHKLITLVPVTEELSSDAPALAAYLPAKSGEAVRWKTNDAFVNGTGAGQPLGIANAAALVTQAKETSQTADTINASNIVKMYARSTNPGRAVWMVNPDAYPQLPLMTIGDQPVFTSPSTGLQGAPNGLLLGRPIIMSDTCQTVGDLGDIYFVDWMAYQTITKAGGPQAATSMHLWFDYDMMAFRLTFRVDGQPWLSSAITPPNSSVTRSPIVTLAARA